MMWGLDVYHLSKTHDRTLDLRNNIVLVIYQTVGRDFTTSFPLKRHTSTSNENTSLQEQSL